MQAERSAAEGTGSVIGFWRRITGKKLPRNLSYEGARAVLESHKRGLEGELAGRPDAEPEMLYYLAERGGPQVRRKVAANPATPAEANRFLADDADPDLLRQFRANIGIGIVGEKAVCLGDDADPDV